MGCRSAVVGEVVSRSLDGRSTSRRWTWRGACRRSHQRRGRHRGGRRPRPVELPRPREVRVFRGVHLDAVRPGIAGRLHGADEPDDVQRTLAGQFALRPSMFQEVGIDEGAVRSIARRPCRPPSASASPPPRRAGAATDPADRRRTQRWLPDARDLRRVRTTPSADEFDLHKLQPAAAQRRPHLARVGPRLTCPREILDAQDRFRRTRQPPRPRSAG